LIKLANNAAYIIIDKPISLNFLLTETTIVHAMSNYKHGLRSDGIHRLINNLLISM